MGKFPSAGICCFGLLIKQNPRFCEMFGGHSCFGSTNLGRFAPRLIQLDSRSSMNYRPNVVSPRPTSTGTWFPTLDRFGDRYNYTIRLQETLIGDGLVDLPPRTPPGLSFIEIHSSPAGWHLLIESMTITYILI